VDCLDNGRVPRCRRIPTQGAGYLLLGSAHCGPLSLRLALVSRTLLIALSADGPVIHDDVGDPPPTDDADPGASEQFVCLVLQFLGLGLRQTNAGRCVIVLGLAV
jgi:hypothetical protein